MKRSGPKNSRKPSGKRRPIGDVRHAWPKIIKHGGAYLRGFSIGSRTLIRTTRRLHHHVAKRPHEHLLRKVRWYARWHTWKWHPHVHYAATGVFAAATIIFTTVTIRQALAAPDLNDSWNFSTPANFVIDDGLETNGSSVRLAPQEYVQDSSTRALFHMNETGGTTITDSSSNANDGTASNISFGAGSLNNAIGFNGTSSMIRVPDSESLSLTQQNSVEAWTKFSSAFSPSSSAQRQSIIDKGDYQLYYDNETGKLTYELADNSATNWALAGGNDVNGSWDLNGKRSVNALTKIGSTVYAAIGVDVGDAEVWMWDGSEWSLIGGGANSINDSWPAQSFEGVYSLSTDGTNIYAGLGASAGDAEVWRWNGTSWTKIGGDAINSSWQLSTFEQVLSLDYFGGNLYAGLGNSANDAEVWRWNGTSWTKIGGDSLLGGWTTNFEGVYSLANDGTNLYAGLGNSTGDAEVWRWNGTAWARLGGDGVNASWNTNYETVRSLVYSGGNLYAGLGDSVTDAEVWRWNGASWTQIGGDGLSSSWNTNYEYVTALASDGTYIYAGLGNSDGDGEVWRWDGANWLKIGGDGVNTSWAAAQGDAVFALLPVGSVLFAGVYDGGGTGLTYVWDGTSWTYNGGNYVNSSWGFYNIPAVQVMQSIGGYLYAGLGNVAGSALVFRYDGTRWTLVGGQGVHSSWAPNSYEQVLSMANYNGHVVVGLGSSANDAEVWEYDGTSWAQIGGDSLNNGWTTNFEEVASLASFGGYLYAGLGNSANDAEVWRWNGTAWTKIGGDSINSGWTTNFERVAALAVHDGQLIAGLGASAGDAEVWRWNGTAWTKIGGDGINSSWNTSYEQVEALIIYNGKIYAGLGNSTDDAELWEYDGVSWSLVGGDGLSNSWDAGTYERVKTLAVYNGDLYAGLGASTGDGEVWRWDGSVWTKIGGNGINNGWGANIEEVESFSAYNGKFYVGLGLNGNADALVYSIGDNGFLQSAVSSFDTNWHHVAATYDGSTMRLYIDGIVSASKTISLTVPDNALPMLIGAGFGGREYGKPSAIFNGYIDEVRISNVARSSFAAKPYASTPQTVTLGTAARTSGVWHWDTFSSDEAANGGNITYRLSSDGGTTWKFWNGSAWATSASAVESNDVATVTAHIATLPVTFDGIKWQAVLTGDGTQRVTLNAVGLASTSDANAPATNATSITAKKANGGTALAQNGWANGSSPYFSWTAGADAESGVLGYCVYIGTDNTADPVTAKGLLGASPIDTGNRCQYAVSTTSLDLAAPGALGAALATSNSPYYIRIKAIDNAGNVTPGVAQFYFRFDNTPPQNPGYITAPSGFVNSKEVTLSWPTSGAAAPDDANSGFVGMQYRIGSSGTWYGDSHTGTGDSSDLLTNDGAYTMQSTPDYADLVEGVNTVYFRAWDSAGNVTATYTTAAVKINTAGAPSEPQNLIATPSTNTTNAFSFGWAAPATFVGDVDNLTYCYTINTLPSASTCTFTSAGVTNLGSGPYATQPGVNAFYVVAKDESGNINYGSYTSVAFTANTSAPGLPRNTDIVDVSIKATSNWRLALTWNAPTDTGAGIASYKIYRSVDNATFSFVGSSSSTTYIDAGLVQQQYYYYVRACDSTNNCGAQGEVVHQLPTGKFTSPATLVADPEVTGVTTRRATISWSTDRGSDSKIAIGTTSGKYSSSEVGNSDQVSAHTIKLDNLSAGTTYYFVTKWTDEDGNTGVSQEYTFRTAPAPTLKEITTNFIGLSSASIRFTSKDASKISVLYGLSDALGGSQSINTALAESTYQVDLNNLTDGSKYYYKLISYDSEGNAYDGSIFSFTTPPRPRITNLRFQPIAGEPTSTQEVTWTTNVPTTSLITYAKLGGRQIESQTSTLVTEHKMIIHDLEDDSEYSLLAQSRDKDGNLAVSDTQTFHTALDTRPPKISNVVIEASIRGTGAEARGQLVVSWKTDEPATSQVAYGEGSNITTFNNKTSEDTGLSTEHIVIVSDLPTSKVYSVEAMSYDKARNVGTGSAESAIIGRASDSVLTIILNSLQKVFGF